MDVNKYALTGEHLLSLVCITATMAMASLFYFSDLVPSMTAALQAENYLRLVEAVVFGILAAFLIYGSLVHQLARLGWVARLSRLPGAEPASDAAAASASVAVLVPSYREEPAVVRRTLLSAALQGHPALRVVLLIDDPAPLPNEAPDSGLRAARALPGEIEAMLAGPAGRFAAVLAALPSDRAVAAAVLAGLHDEAAAQLHAWAGDWPRDDHADDFFCETVLGSFADEHREAAAGLRCGVPSVADLDASRRLILARFAARLTSFERKAFVNLPHEPNKAMNLNAYIACLGRRFRFVAGADGARLLPAADGAPADLEVPAADFLVTLDADSVILAGYIRRLLGLMQAPANERLAVAQTPYASFDRAPSRLERLAGATTDVQLLLHQGFTHYGATFWVGANAVIRHAALLDIEEQGTERGFVVRRFIQDRTVIEDTESTIDLVAKGWSLYNLPERLAFSATPPDFGSLIIQRRRWACGGLLILPKLVGHLATALRERRRPVRAVLAEALIRAHYLGSLAWVPVAVLTLLLVPFSDATALSLWLPLTALPYFVVYGRDLALAGYRGVIDLPRVYALNLLLLPVNLAGALGSLQQAATGRKVPFRRTPKIAGRTAAAPGLVAAIWGLAIWCAFCLVSDLWLGNWMHAAFVGLNGAMLGYAAFALVGWRESLADLGIALPERRPLPTLGVVRSG